MWSELPFFNSHPRPRHIFLSQSILSFQGSILSPRRNSRSSVFSYRGGLFDDGGFADDEHSPFDKCSRRGSLFLPHKSRFSKRHISGSSASSLFLRSATTKAPSSVNHNGMMSDVAGGSLPSSPACLRLPVVTVDAPPSGDDVRMCPLIGSCQAKVFFYLSNDSHFAIYSFILFSCVSFWFCLI